MTPSEARAAAADAIRAKFPETDADGRYIVRVVEIDPITERDIPRLADGIFTATDATVPADRGPAAIAVAFRERDETQAIGLVAYTIVRNRLEIELAETGRGRGLATLDLVEEALSALPAGLPNLFVESAAVRLPATVVDRDPTTHVYVTRCTWPPAFPADQNPAATGAMDAIRDHFAAAITAGLPAATAAQAGAHEADWRDAVIAGTVPRARVALETRRETLGGEHDLTVIAARTWTDDADNEWRARVAEQEVVVTVTAWHRTEPLADTAVARIMGELDGTSVNWPGDFDALVPDASNVLQPERRAGADGGNYRQAVTLLNRTPATWDAAAGLHKAMLQATVQSVTQLTAATALHGPLIMRKSTRFRSE